MTRIEDILDGVGWGLFFLWVGIALLIDVGWGIGLIGVGVITLTVQAARKCYKLRLEGFWIIFGLVLMLGGIWEILQIQVDLVPVLFIIAGVALLISVFRKK
jgi:hypothetical protein